MSMTYVGMDVHKRTISVCARREDGRIVSEETIEARREALRVWAAGVAKPWVGALEATLFTGWIYDVVQPYAQAVKVGNPLRLKAISAGKKKNDRIDAATLANLLRCDLLPECYMAPAEIRDLRRALRYRNWIVHQSVRMQTKASGLLMEVGAEYKKSDLRGRKRFDAFVDNLEEAPESVKALLRVTRSQQSVFDSLQRRLKAQLARHPLLAERVERLMTIPGVGEVTALVWALEVGDPHRFASAAKAISYCGLCSAQRSSAGQDKRGPISKQRNKHLQATLVEAAKLAPRWNARLAEAHARELGRGHKNRATLAVARKLVAYLLAVDRSGRPFELRGGEPEAPSHSQRTKLPDAVAAELAAAAASRRGSHTEKKKTAGKEKRNS